MSISFSKLLVILAWSMLILSGNILATNSEIDSSFQASNNHILLLISNLLIIFLCLLFIAYRRKLIIFDTYTKLQLISFFYFFVTVLWSSMKLVSLGQAVYCILNLIFAHFIVLAINTKNSNKKQLNSLIKLWGGLIFIDYFISVYFDKRFPFATFDERSLIAFSIFFYFSISNLNRFSKYLFLYLVFIGQSLTALIGSVVLFLYYSVKKRPVISILILIPSLTLIILYLYQLVDKSVLTIAGKNLSLILTGSGRFNVWKELLQGIYESNIANIIFGHGYLSERDYLSKLSLSWSTDAHNNFLQSLYGVGLIGTSFMLLIWIFPHLNSKIKKLKNNDNNIYLWLLGTNLSFIIFGLSNSYFYSRPSFSAVFMTSVIILILKQRHEKI